MSTRRSELASCHLAIKEKLNEIVLCIKSDVVLWRDCHESGWQLVLTISKLQSKCLSVERNLSSLKTSRRITSENMKLYQLRRELGGPAAQLLACIDQLERANERTHLFLKQLREWCKVVALNQHVFYRNWKLLDFMEFLDRLVRLYDAEYEVKLMVAEDLAVLQTQKELRLFRIAWQIPRHALTPEFSAMFDKLNFETNS